MPVTLKLIAEKSGFSLNTVSRVLRGESASHRPEVCERILRVASETGYRPNPLAQRLNGMQSHVLGFVVGTLSNPFFVEVAHYLDLATREAGYELLLDASYGNEWKYREHKFTSSWLIDGAFVWASSPIDLKRYLGKHCAGIAAVYFCLTEDHPLDSIKLDHYDGARQLMAHLVDRSYRKIAFVCQSGPIDPLPVDGRCVAYLDVCAECGIQPSVLYLPADEDIRTSVFSLVDELVAKPSSSRPDAILCSGDIIAISLYHAIKRAGLQVPGDMAVAGFDGTENGKWLDRSLTTLVWPLHSMTRQAVELMIGQLGAQSSWQPTQIVAKGSLRIGETT